MEVVDAAYVCMVNDAVYEKKQVHVQVDGKDRRGFALLAAVYFATTDILLGFTGFGPGGGFSFPVPAEVTGMDIWTSFGPGAVATVHIKVLLDDGAADDADLKARLLRDHKLRLVCSSNPRTAEQIPAPGLRCRHL